ncbi:MAG: HAMP domain-containing sensor histidine kinase [Bdellovibrionota bacterium]
MKKAKQESVKNYWSRRVIYPTATGAFFLVCFVISFAIYNVRSSEQRGLEAVVNTLALFVADPILLGDEVEIIKRVSSVGSKQNLTIVVKDSSGKALVSFPSTFGNGPDIKDAIEHDVISNSGAVVGKIWVKGNDSSLHLDQVTILIIVAFAFLGLMLLGIIRSFKPIFKDLLGLRELKGESGNQNPDIFSFTETQETYNVIQEQSKKLILGEREKLTAQIARQVAHDIRSPLTTLKIFSDLLPQLPERDRVAVRDALFSINDIANSLLERGRGGDSDIEVKNSEGRAAQESKSAQLISSLVDAVVSEKRLQFKAKMNVKIEARFLKSSYGLFSDIQPNTFKRVLSNLINNAVEAVPNQGYIYIDVALDKDMVKLEVTDSGIGIAEDILPQIGFENATFGKPDGQGLGLYHAKNAIESWDGKLKIKSQLSVGTTIEILLPRVEAPSWFCRQLLVENLTSVVVLDDDPSIHKVWDQRLEPFSEYINIFHFSTVDEIMGFYWGQADQKQDILFLCDYELINQPMNGLEIIEALKISKNATLVTSRFDEKGVRDACTRLGVKLVPKGLAGHVPIFNRRESAVQLVSP